MQELLVESVRAAGAVLLDHFGRTGEVRQKENQSSIVTAADVAAEKRIVEMIRARFPEHNILAEESGFENQGSAYTWVIDPLDGTSNFAAGIPWFGVLLAVLEHNRPILGAAYLPVPGTLYFSEAGQGVFRDGVRVWTTDETRLSHVLCACGLDASGDLASTRRDVELLTRLVSRVRNVRFTNCLLDICLTVDGRLGGWINHGAKIWDIAPASLMLPEAGGLMTDRQGREIRFQLGGEPPDRDYVVVAASRALHPQILDALASAHVP
jgi:myo-inositol-1(or 4)-monophosphatase